MVWPETGILRLGAPEPSKDTTTVQLLGYEGHFSWAPGSQGGMDIILPAIPFYKMPCQWAWVMKLQGLKNHCIIKDGICVVA